MSVSGGQCVENRIHLVGELSQNQGFVVICLGGTWGKVCEDEHRWYSINNKEEEAKVVCRQLGFSTEGDYIIATVFNNLLHLPILLYSYI